MTRSIRSSTWAAAAAVAAALALAACGDDDDDNGQPGPAPTATSRIWVVADSPTLAPARTPPDELTAAERAAFLAGTHYVNAHTQANTGGEIRGQLDAAGDVRYAALDGGQERPTAVTTNAFGAGVLSVDQASGTVRGFVITRGLTGETVAHVHQGARDAAGPPIVTLTRAQPDLWVVPEGSVLTADQRAAFLAGNLYFNVHTGANPDGEIRGQLDKSGTQRFASLNGAQETPAGSVTTAAVGSGVLALDEATGAVSGFVISTGLTDDNNAHIHGIAPRGTAAGPIVQMEGRQGLWVIPDDAAAITPAQVAAVLAGQTYYNVHTPAYPGGEIRGQLDKAGTPRVATLTGDQERPTPVTTTARGGALIAVDDATGDVAGFLVTSGLANTTAAHVHSGSRDVAGPILVPLVP